MSLFHLLPHLFADAVKEVELACQDEEVVGESVDVVGHLVVELCCLTEEEDASLCASADGACHVG